MSGTDAFNEDAEAAQRVSHASAEEARVDILRTLVSVSDTVDEADGYIVDYSDKYKFPNLLGKTETDVIIDKYNFVRDIFGIGESLAVPSTVPSDNPERLMYRALLSTLIIQRPWGEIF